jgi:hypothetical protein
MDLSVNLSSICHFVVSGTSLPAINHLFKHPQSDPAGFFAAAFSEFRLAGATRGRDW